MLEYDLKGFKGEFKGRVGEVTGVAIDGWLRGREVAVASPGCLYANMTLQFVDLTERVNQARRSVRLHQRGETGCDGEVVGGAKRNQDLVRK
jgi:predicted nucleic acid-binding Zn ribbon protein